ncbi:MAG: c-type cytochrome [Proteobacteria bacterium]|nr:c-type cytochrome [Pseudomonadota bacterium]
MKAVASAWVLIVMASLTACGESEAPAPAELSVVEAFMQDPEALNRGQALFIGTCAGYCHKTTPEETDAVFLFDCQWKHGGSDQEIFDTVTVGVPNTRMVGFGSNFPEGEDDLWKIIAYLRTNQRPCS